MDDLNIEPVPFLWVEDEREDAYTTRTRKYNNKKKKEMVGWASRQLIQFLKSLGRETGKAIPQSEIAELIGKYITENKLIHPEKRKRVICDERLFSLFGRKTIGRIKIYDLLEAHLAENQEDSDDDLLSSSDEDLVAKRQRVVTQERKTLYKKVVPQVPKTSLAAISPENIKLVYLKRTLVQELLKQPDTFEVKVSGGFVRIKTDPLDIFQKNSHQLQIVKGVKTLAQAGDNSSCTHLHISGPINEISVSEISDDNFSEAECEDLLKRMKDGLIKQPTMGELEQKVMILHEDITKHWLTKELALLKNLFDRANEKGWRPRAAEYLDKKKLLETPAEQERLVSEIPQVKAEEEKTEIVPEDPLGSVSYNDEDSPKAADWDWELSYDSPAKGIITNALSEEAHEAELANELRSNGDAQISNQEQRAPLNAGPPRLESNGHVISFKHNERHIPDIKPYGHVISFEQKERNVIAFEKKERSILETERILPEINGNVKFLNPCRENFSLTIETKEKTKGSLQNQISNKQDRHLKVENAQSKQIQVIDLSDDDEEEKQEVPSNRKQIPSPSPRLNPSPRPRPNPGPSFSSRPNPSSSPSPRPNPSPSPSPRPNPSPSPSPRPNPSPSLSSRSNPSPNPSPSPRPSPSHSRCPNPNPNPSPSPSPSPRSNPSPSLSSRPNPSRSPSPRTNPSPSPSLNCHPNPSTSPSPYPNPNVVPLLEQSMWHYYDPQRTIQGPFSLSALKCWRDANFFPADFRVWRTGQNPFDAVLLNDLIHQIYSN